MKNTKKVIAGLMALSMLSAFTACGNKEEDETPEETTTTTVKTVAINTEELKDDEAAVLEDVMNELRDVELENKTVKWLAHYDINPSTETGASKSVALEMFERKYGGKIEHYPTTWENRMKDLTKYVSSDEGIDIFPGDDTANFPAKIVSGAFQPVDTYIDVNSPLWQNVSEGMQLMYFSGRYYELVTSISAEHVVLYDKSTIEEHNFDDPWDMYEAGKWNWDTFKSMLLEFVDPDEDRYGLDGYWNEKALLMSAGVPFVSTDSDGTLVCNVDDPTIEKAMDYMYQLNKDGLKFPKAQFSVDWKEQPQFMGEGKTLFYIIGSYAIEKDPETWVTEVEPQNCGIVPVPSPEGSPYYQGAKVNGFALCKGAHNPEGAALYAECCVLGTFDERAQAISDRKSMDDFKWDEELLNKVKEINRLARENPVVDLSTGCSTQIAGITTDGGDDVGLRAAFNGTEWSTTRDAMRTAIINAVDKVDKDVKTKLAEG